MKLFPIMWPMDRDVVRLVEDAGFKSLRVIPWDMIAPHEAQAQKNHHQSLAELASRGGLSACEAVAVLQDRPWRKMLIGDAYARLDQHVRAWHEERAEQPTAQPVQFASIADAYAAGLERAALWHEEQAERCIGDIVEQTLHQDAAVAIRKLKGTP
jgi:hypothetical protein